MTEMPDMSQPKPFLLIPTQIRNEDHEFLTSSFSKHFIFGMNEFFLIQRL